MSADLFDAMTPREWEVVDLLMRGGRVATIARDLGISPVTVRNHLASIFSKAGVHSQAELVTRVQELQSAGDDVRHPDLARHREIIHASNQKLLADVTAALESADPLAGLKQALRNFLPIEPEARAAWASRLAYWGILSQNPESDASPPLHSAVEGATRIAVRSRERGLLRPDADPARTIEDFVHRIFAAALPLLISPDPARRDAELAALDRQLEALRPPPPGR